MKRTLFITVLTSLFFAASSAFAWGLDPQYVWAEHGLGCGATPPTWQSQNFFSEPPSQTSETYAVNGGFERYNIDSVRVKVKCDDCELYSHSASNWYWWDAYQDNWRGSVDLGGLHYQDGDDYYYRAEERDAICNDDYYRYYGNEPIMQVQWSITTPGTQRTALFEYPPIII